MIALVTPEEALQRVVASVFSTPTRSDAALTDELLAQLARRAVSFLAPCPSHELVKAVVQSFVGSPLDNDALVQRTDDIVEQLIVYGDLLEMRPRSADDWIDGTKRVVLPAPPSFIEREDGSIAILGVAGDDVTPLTAEHEARVIYRGALRILPPSDDDDIPAHLVELGLLRLSEKTWLRLPEMDTAAQHLGRCRVELDRQPRAVSLDGVQIIDTAQSPAYYSGRWCEPKSQSGIYVGRRPQRYGAALWSLVELQKGSVCRFLDLGSSGDRLRPVDVAWRIQAALDAVSGNPQVFRCTEASPDMALIRFYSPLPSWCERRLSIVGEKTKADRCLFSYEVPRSHMTNEVKFLQDALWMAESAKQ